MTGSLLSHSAPFALLTLEHSRRLLSACRLYIKATPCALHLCARFALFALSLCSPLHASRLCLPRVSSRCCGRCGRLFSLAAAAARRSSRLSRPPSRPRVSRLASPRASPLASFLSLRLGRCARLVSRGRPCLSASPLPSLARLFSQHDLFNCNHSGVHALTV